MAYTSDKKPGALVAATILDGNNNVVVEQSGDVKRATLSQVEAKIFDAKTATTTPTGTEVVVVRQTDNTLRQVALADIVPAGNIVDAKISASAAIADTKLATINTAGKVTNNAVQAVATNTPNRIVTRDGSGNFAAGTITATLFSGAVSGNVTGNVTGNASGSASTLATGRTIALTGDVTGTTGSFNGSANVSAATTIANNAVTTAKIADANVTNVKIASGVDAAKLTTGTLPAARIGNSAIDEAKIADSAVTNVKIASGVDAAKLTTGTLPIARIADGAVTDAKLASGIDAGKLTTGTLPDARIGSNAINNARIADGAVTNAKLSLNANDGEIKKALNANNNPPIYACRAWVNFNGLAAVTDNLSGSYSTSGALVQITILNHGLISGNIVRLTFSGTSPVPAAGTYTVISVVSADVFRIIAGSNPDSGSSGSTTWLRRLIRASGNVSSVTNTATAGKHIVNFAVPMPTSDYAISLGANTGSPVIGTATEQATQQAFYIIGANSAEVTTAVFA